MNVSDYYRLPRADRYGLELREKKHYQSAPHAYFEALPTTKITPSQKNIALTFSKVFSSRVVKQTSSAINVEDHDRKIPVHLPKDRPINRENKNMYICRKARPPLFC